MLPEGSRSCLIVSATFCFSAPATPPVRSLPRASSGKTVRVASMHSRRAASRRASSIHSPSRCSAPWATRPTGYRSKSWDEFAKPGAPEMDFIFTVCDSAAGEACPIWPGHPATAHWGIEDPAAVRGSEIEKERAFVQAAKFLKTRISLFLNLPIGSLDQISAGLALAGDRPCRGRDLTPARGRLRSFPMDVIIYHNPDCGTSRNTLGLIRNAGIEPHIIEYLKTPPTAFC